MIQALIALDQLANTLVWADDEGFGKADETISARAWRLRHRTGWGRFQRALDWLAARMGDENHCFKSWRSEITRRQLPDHYAKYCSACPVINFQHHENKHGTAG